MTRIKARDGSFECETSEPIGRGREGEIYKATVVNHDELGNLALKVMMERNSSRVLAHTEQLLSWKTMRSFSLIPSLECLLITPFISCDNECCLLMPLADGCDLRDEENFIKLGKSLPWNRRLYLRLYLAYQIALGIKVIHDAGIIHADIAGENIMISANQARAFVIDIDGGGLVNSMKPRVRGHVGWLAPELVLDPSLYSTQETDCWSLALLLHYIIVGCNPFLFCKTVKDYSDYERDWPPDPNRFSDQSIKSWLMWQRKVLTQTQDLTNLFSRCFRAGQRNCRLRPTASEWEQCLKKQLGNAPSISHHCPKCGHENDWQLVYCSSCGTTVLHQALIHCPNCHEYTPVSASFCPRCGAKQGP